MSGRLAMPGAMPAELAERLSDVPSVITAALLDQAREEMIDRLLEGKQVGRITFEGIFEHNLDQGVVDTGEAARHLLNVIDYGKDEHAHVERRRDLERWLRGMVERWVDSHEDLIRERAEELAADEGADEC